jgi:hypothetical protein
MISFSKMFTHDLEVSLLKIVFRSMLHESLDSFSILENSRINVSKQKCLVSKCTLLDDLAKRESQTGWLA